VRHLSQYSTATTTEYRQGREVRACYNIEYRVARK